MNLRKPKLVERPSYQNNLVKLFAEAGTHLTASQFHNYIFRRETLNPNQIKDITDHIDKCTRCSSEIESINQDYHIYKTAIDYFD